jgi:hypothetical protein
MQTTYKQVQIPRNMKLFLRVVTLIAQTQGHQQNKEVQLAQTQRSFIQQHHTCFKNNINITAVNSFTLSESALFLVIQCHTANLQAPTPVNSYTQPEPDSLHSPMSDYQT